MSRLLCLLKFKTLINLKTFTILAFLISHIGMLYFETQVGGICSCCTPLLEPELDTNPLLLCWSFVWNSECYVWLGCCKAAITFPSDSKCWLDLNQKTIFSYLIDKIYCESGFLEALRLVKAVIQKNEALSTDEMAPASQLGGRNDWRTMWGHSFSRIWKFLLYI